jgi:SAM-dependent methyltransferase
VSELGVGRFAFGRNWLDYAKGVGEEQIAFAIRGLERLLGDVALREKTFLDVGCGSGVHSVAALRLGARRVVAVDVDPDSVAAAGALLARYAGSHEWHVRRADLFELDPRRDGQFDVVHAWGVLHHTGALQRAIGHCATLVAPGGLLVMALYRKTWLCWLWKAEKWFYARASLSVQATVRWFYLRLFSLRLRATGRTLRSYAEGYIGNRGMSFCHDVHDWLGGWPYESITPAEVERIMTYLGFVAVRSFVRPGRVLGRDFGLFGSGCDEYVFLRSGSA